jgi:hypothetical protein
MMEVVFTISSCTVSQSCSVTGEPSGTKAGMAKTTLFGDVAPPTETAAKEGGFPKQRQLTTRLKIFFILYERTR